MNVTADDNRITLSISAVERDTGISKDTLRVWERRYGFPDPERDRFGERVYSMEQVDKLRLIRRLLDLGHRPGRIVRYSTDDLQALAAQVVPVQTPGDLPGNFSHSLEDLMVLVRGHEVAELRLQLAQMALKLGLERFTLEVAAPLNEMVGDAWARGFLAIYEEHLYTESMQVVLRSAISNIPVQSATGPCVLLSTFPAEQHGIGLLMVEAVLALNGCRCISLGTQTPVFEIAVAANELRCDIVALSFSSVLNPNVIGEGITQLRDELPMATEIWVGGRGQNATRRPLDGVRMQNSLSAIRADLRRWYADHAE